MAGLAKWRFYSYSLRYPGKRAPAKLFGCLLTRCCSLHTCDSRQVNAFYKLMERVRTVRSNRPNSPILP